MHLFNQIDMKEVKPDVRSQSNYSSSRAHRKAKPSHTIPVGVIDQQCPSSLPTTNLNPQSPSTSKPQR